MINIETNTPAQIMTGKPFGTSFSCLVLRHSAGKHFSTIQWALEGKKGSDLSSVASESWRRTTCTGPKKKKKNLAIDYCKDTFTYWTPPRLVLGVTSIERFKLFSFPCQCPKVPSNISAKLSLHSVVIKVLLGHPNWRHALCFLTN